MELANTLYALLMYQVTLIYMMYSHFAVVDCVNLTDPANGQVDHTAGTPFGQTATYRCNTGYNLVGDSIHTCQATGEWSGSAPTCKGILLSNMGWQHEGTGFIRGVLVGVYFEQPTRWTDFNQTCIVL